MNANHDISAEIELRIQNELKTFQGNLPERYALAWHGYLAGLMEWGVIELEHYKHLQILLPPIAAPNPIPTIFSGRE
jgi:hypothetical protein